MTTTATTTRKNLELAIDDIETQLKRIQNAADEIYKIKNILTAAYATGQIITEEAAKSASEQFERQLANLERLGLMSGATHYILCEAHENSQIA